MSHSVHPLSAWRPYAEEIIQRLMRVRFPSDDHHVSDHGDLDVEDDRPTIEEVLSRAKKPDASDRRPADREGSPLPSPRLPAAELLLALRLAATLGSEARLQACVGHDALTVVTSITAADVPIALRLLRYGILAPELPVTASRRSCSPGTLLVLAPEISGGEISKRAQEIYLERIEAALDHEGGLLLLAPDGIPLPRMLESGLHDRLQLAALDRELLLTLLRHSHGGCDATEEAALRACLPEDRALARLTSAGLRLALRAPTVLAVVERLRRLLPAQGSGVPDLARMGGDSPALQAARRLVADLWLWQEGKVRWRDLSRSLLLYGPPGTGKTWLARAMGNTAGVHLVEASFAQWQAAGHLGDMLREMRKTFAEARHLAPAILFIDEIDAVGSRSDGDRQGSSYRRQVINGFLGEMDMIARQEGVLVVGACNDPGAIDPAVIRPGRFDLVLPMPLPDADALHGILASHLEGELSPAELRALATAAIGRSAAELDAAIRAARAEARHGGRPLDPAAIRRQLGFRMDEAQAAFDWRVAVHECGHAIACVAWGCGEVERVLITPRGGETHRRPRLQQGLLADLDAEIASHLAGRAAEGLLLGTLSAGSGGPEVSDLAQANRLAVRIEANLGLGADGPLWIPAPVHELLRDPALRARVQRRLEAAEAHAGELLMSCRDLLDDMARALLAQRELAGEDLASWLDRIRRQAVIGPTGHRRGPSCVPADAPPGGSGQLAGDRTTDRGELP